MSITLLHLQIKSFTLFPLPSAQPAFAHHHPSAFACWVSREPALFSLAMAMKITIGKYTGRGIIIVLVSLVSSLVDRQKKWCLLAFKYWLPTMFTWELEVDASLKCIIRFKRQCCKHLMSFCECLMCFLSYLYTNFFQFLHWLCIAWLIVFTCHWIIPVTVTMVWIVPYKIEVGAAHNPGSPA